MTDEHVPQGENPGDGTDADFQQWSNEVNVDGAAAGPASESPADELADARRQLSERTEDLQRVQAEYVNYKRRVDRDRALARQSGIEAVMLDLLPTLDAIDQAREHGDLTGGFKLVADELERLAAKYGLVAYGEVGDEFDPQLHDAMMTAPSQPGQSVPQCAMVMQRGYKLKDRIVRHARVAVSEPDPTPGADHAG